MSFLYEAVYVDVWQRARNKGHSILYKWDGKFACRGQRCEQGGGGTESARLTSKMGGRKGN
jgi:hypothetical protein